MPGIGLFGALDIGISGLMTSRLATQVINHNIANANTPGYSRQGLALGSARPLVLPYGALGRGAVSLGVQRYADMFLERQVHDQTAVLGSHTALDEGLGDVEQILGSVDSSRIGDALAGFFGAWADLATPPITDGKRASVVSQAQSLALQFREVDSSLATLQRERRMAIRASVDESNSLLSRIAALNEQILAAKTNTQLPNDLLDQRGLLLEELSNLTRVHVEDRGDGTVDVIVEGRTLVSRGTANLMRIEEDELADGTVSPRVVFGGRDAVPVDFAEGEIAGLLRTVNESIPAYRSRMDALARDLMKRVNDLHVQGTGPQGSGIALFVGSSAATMAVNPIIAADSRLVVTGRSGEAGDNELALEIAALGDSVSDGAERSLNEEYTQMIVELASERGAYQTLREGQIAVVEASRARLESRRGVSLDEELAQLMVFQRSYEANARVIRAVDEMLDTLINGMI